jgi:hypothetical protein
VSDEWAAEDVLVALERRGYQRLAASEALGKALRYQSPYSSTEAGQYVHLNYKPAGRGYDLWVGFSNAVARELLERRIDSIRSLAGGVFPPVGAPYWTMFNACRVLGGYHVIPDPTNRRAGPQQFAALTEKFLAPVFETTRSPADILERLLRDQLPFEWVMTNRVTRAAEIMATALAAGQQLGAVMPLLLQRTPRQGNLGQGWAEMLEKIAALLGRQTH